MLPAHAGMIPLSRRGSRRSRCAPRTCGDDPTRISATSSQLKKAQTVTKASNASNIATATVNKSDRKVAQFITKKLTTKFGAKTAAKIAPGAISTVAKKAGGLILKGTNAAGDVIRHYFDAQGQLVSWSGADRLIALSVEQLRHIPTVIGVAVSTAKAAAIVGASRSRLINTLVTDVRTAQAVLDLCG